MDIPAQVKADLQKELETLEAVRLKAKSNTRTALFIAIGVAVVALIIYLFTKSIGVIGGGVILGAIIYGSVYFIKFGKYKTEFKLKVIPAIVKAISPGLRYSHNSHISRGEFINSEIFKQRVDRFSGEDYFQGTIGQTEVEFSELHAQEKHTTTDSKGRTKTTYVTFFKGLFMIADFHKDFKGSTIVLPDTAEKTFGGWLGKKLQSWNISREDLVYLEDPEFEKEFVVYGSDQVEARYILSTSLMRRILELKHQFKCPIYLSFLRSKVYIAIYSNKNMLEPSLSKSLLDQGAIQKFFDEINLCVDIVDQLNLNTRIWSKQD